MRYAFVKDGVVDHVFYTSIKEIAESEAIKNEMVSVPCEDENVIAGWLYNGVDFVEVK